MTFQQQLSSWLSPTNYLNQNTQVDLKPPPSTGSRAPSTLKLSFDQRGSEQASGADHSHRQDPTILAFLRHCGCPFAEKTYLNLRETARAHKNISFIAISQSSPSATESWLKSLAQHGSETSNFSVVVDEEVEIYRAWGLGVSGYSHVVGFGSLYAVWKLGSEEGIWNRPTESGSRWQIGGAFGVDGEGVVRWGKAAERADEIPDFEEGVEVLMEGGGRMGKGKGREGGA